MLTAINGRFISCSGFCNDGKCNDDAFQYSDWLNRKAGPPMTCNLRSGGFMDENGSPVVNVTSANRHRLPTEVESKG